MAGLARSERLRVSFILSLFAFAWALLLWPGSDDDKEKHRLQLLSKVQGLAILDLGLSVSVDELTIGFSLGLLGLALVATVVWIALPAFVTARLGLWVGGRLGEAVREKAEKFAGLLLLVMSVVLLILKLKKF